MGVETTIWSDTRGSDTSNGPSGRIFKTNYNRYMQDPTLGRLFRPDFYNCPKFASGVSQMGFITYQDTGVTIQGDPTLPGVLKWDAMDADNDCGTITTCGGTGTQFLIDHTSPKRLKFEVSVKKQAVTDNSTGFFIGLTEEAMTAGTSTLLATDTAAPADKDLIGFSCLQSNGDSVDFVYNKSGAGGVTTKISGVAALVADTWIKLGFDYNPFAPAAKRITVFVDGLPQSTYVTETQLEAATFPDGEELVPTISFKKGEATEADAFIRLWMCVQAL